MYSKCFFKFSWWSYHGWSRCIRDLCRFHVMCPFLGSCEMVAKAHIFVTFFLVDHLGHLQFKLFIDLYQWSSVDITDHVPRPMERNIHCSTLNDISSLRNVYPLELTCCCAFSHFVEEARLGPRRSQTITQKAGESLVTLAYWAGAI